jgi:hypothetical protein
MAGTKSVDAKDAKETMNVSDAGICDFEFVVSERGSP